MEGRMAEEAYSQHEDLAALSEAAGNVSSGRFEEFCL